MSTTIPFPFAEYHDPLAHDAKINDTLDALIQFYESALRNSDKADTMEDSSYHQGKADAFTEALLLLLPVPDEAWDAYQGGAWDTYQGKTVPTPPASGEGWDLMELYHFTSPESAWAIVSTGKWVSAENTGFVYASTHRHGQATGYGDAAVRIMVPKACAVLDDEFPDGEKHYRVDPTAILNLGPAS